MTTLGNNMKIIKYFICAILVAGIYGCSDQLDKSAEVPRIGLVMKSLANEFFLSMETEAKNHQKENSDRYTLISNGIKNEQDVAGQIRIVEQMIALEVDAIVIAPADSSALLSVLDRAISSGIVVVNIDNRLSPDALKSKNLEIPFVGPDNKKGAMLVAEFLAKHLSPNDKVAILSGHPASDNSRQRVAGFTEIMEKVQADIVAKQSGMWEMGKANNITSVLLNENPDLKAILCANDSMALGAVSAVKAAGREGDVLIVGYDNITAIQVMLEQGRVLATIDQFADKQAVSGIELALNMIDGGKDKNGGSQVVETPVKLVTAETSLLSQDAVNE